MIREAASNIVEIPFLTISGEGEFKKIINHISILKNAFRSIPYMIEQFWANMQHISHNYKWCKIVLLRKNIPIDIFDYMKPYFSVINHGELYHVEPQVPTPIYHIPIRSKLYRMGYIDDRIMDKVNELFIKKRIPYITEPWPSHYYYHPHFSISLFIQTLAMLMGSNRHLEPLLVMRYWL
jgi:hypothetical protein